MKGNHSFRHIYDDWISKHGDAVDYAVFKEILERLFKKLAKRIIYGYKFTIGYGVGLIEVVKIARTFSTNENGVPKVAVDWGASNKRKAELLKEGRTPYKKKTAPNGVKWLVFHTALSYYRWKWYKKSYHMIPNLTTYNFKPTYTNRMELAQYIKAQENDL